ncbi:MAG: type II CRISPR RNA-guided endonuclease Cas9, partial [Thermodesulfobacteriota bacterium]
MDFTVGLDIGSNSIGWAIVDKKAKKIVGTGVSIFQEGVNRRVRGGKENTRNSDRRKPRQMRREYFRKHVRKEWLIELLKKMKMYPKSVSDVDMFLKIDPYEMRKKGLTKKLELFEIGRVLYHLIQRRGFKSNRKIQGSDEGKIFDGMESAVGIRSTQKSIQDGGFKTLGEYLDSIKMNDGGERRRGRYTLRSMYQFEFDTILRKQRAFYKNVLSKKNIEQLHDAIFF